MKTILNKKVTVAIIVLICLTAMFCLTSINSISAEASVISRCTREEIYYSDDTTYSDSSASESTTETINYSYKVKTGYMINPSYTQYYNTNSSLTNTCANTAGANIVGFYDRYFDNLIPNYTTGVVKNDIFTYYPMSYESAKKQDVINALYSLMGTNNPLAGTSQAEYKTGLTSYVSSRGKSISYISVKSGSSFSLSSADTQFKAGRPISLFLSGYNITTINDNGTVANIYRYEYDTNHIMIAYGYEQVDYYNSNNALLKSITYMRVASGSQTLTGVYILNNNGTINDAEAAYIY